MTRSSCPGPKGLVNGQIGAQRHAIDLGVVSSVDRHPGNRHHLDVLKAKLVQLLSDLRAELFEPSGVRFGRPQQDRVVQKRVRHERGSVYVGVCFDALFDRKWMQGLIAVWHHRLEPANEPESLLLIPSPHVACAMPYGAVGFDEFIASIGGVVVDISFVDMFTGHDHFADLSLRGFVRLGATPVELMHFVGQIDQSQGRAVGNITHQGAFARRRQALRHVDARHGLCFGGTIDDFVFALGQRAHDARTQIKRHGTTTNKQGAHMRQLFASFDDGVGQLAHKSWRSGQPRDAMALELIQHHVRLNRAGGTQVHSGHEGGDAAAQVVQRHHGEARAVAVGDALGEVCRDGVVLGAQVSMGSVGALWAPGRSGCKRNQRVVMCMDSAQRRERLVGHVGAQRAQRLRGEGGVINIVASQAIQGLERRSKLQHLRRGDKRAGVGVFYGLEHFANTHARVHEDGHHTFGKQRQRERVEFNADGEHQHKPITLLITRLSQALAIGFNMPPKLPVGDLIMGRDAFGCPARWDRQRELVGHGARVPHDQVREVFNRCAHRHKITG